MKAILVRMPNHLGDCVMALPAIGAALSCRSDFDYHLMYPAWAGVLFRDLPAMQHLPLEQPYLHGPAAIRMQTGLIREFHFDGGALLTPSFSSALIFYLGGVRRRYGYAREGRGMFLNRPVAPMGVTGHRSQSYLHLMSALCETDLQGEPPQVDITDDLRGSVRGLLNGFGFRSDEEYVVIAPRAVAASRRWGAQNYAALAAKICGDMNLRVLLLGTAGERADGDIIACENPGVVNLCGQTEIGQAAAILVGARLFVGNDSGLAHLAAAVQVPLVVLSGADLPSETSPLSDDKIVLIKDHLECISCVKNVCPFKDERQMQCMRQITVEEVYAATRRQLEQSP